MILGIDCAAVDGNLKPAWAVAKASGPIRFAFLRGAYGDAPDAAFPREWPALGAAGVTRGAYLFLRFPRVGHPAPARPRAQVDAFVDTVGVLTHRDFPPTLDLEFEHGRRATGLTVGESLAWVLEAWEQLKAAYGAPPLVYTSARVWREELDDVAAPRLAESPLWVAKPWPWAVRTPAHRDAAAFTGGAFEPEVPSPWGSQWFIHQYQGDALGFPGFSSTVDVNRFRAIPPGATGDHVAWLQRRLRIPTSGVFDVATRSAVIAHQIAQGLVPDGIVGPRTFASLCWS